MNLHNLLKRYFFIVSIVVCASLGAMKAPIDLDPSLVLHIMLMTGYNNYLQEKQYDKAYDMATAVIVQHKDSPVVFAWHKNRLTLVINNFSSDNSKVADAKKDCWALMNASRKIVGIDVFSLVLDFFHLRTLTGDEEAFTMLEQCLQIQTHSPLIRFMACNHCMTLALDNKAPQATARMQSYFTVCPLLAQDTLAVFDILDDQTQRYFIGKFLNNASRYLQRKMSGPSKASPHDPGMIRYRDLIIAFLKKNNGRIEFNNEYGDYASEILAPLYENCTNKETICEFLFPLVELLLRKSEWEQHSNSPVRNATHSLLIQLTGLSYFHGAGVTLDYKKAADYLNRAVDKCAAYRVLPDTVYSFSYMLMSGRGCQKNLALAEKGFTSLIPLKNKNAAQALHQLGILKCVQNNYDQADTHFANAKSLLKSLLDANQPDQDERKALKFLLISAVHDAAHSATQSKNYKTAVSKFTELATELATIDCSDIQIPAFIEFDYLILGDLNAHGLGIARSAAEALNWYARAAQSCDHANQQEALQKIIRDLSDPKVQADENIRRAARTRPYTIGFVKLPTHDQGWPALTATGIIDYETAIARMAELSLHRPSRTPEDINFAGRYFRMLSKLCYGILQRKNDSPEQAAEIEPHRTKLQKLHVATYLGLGEAWYQLQNYPASKEHFAFVTTNNHRPDLKGYAWLRLGDLHKNKLLPDSSPEAARDYYTKASTQTDHLPSKKAAEERLKEFKKP